MSTLFEILLKLSNEIEFFLRFNNHKDMGKLE